MRYSLLYKRAIRFSNLNYRVITNSQSGILLNLSLLSFSHAFQIALTLGTQTTPLPTIPRMRLGDVPPATICTVKTQSHSSSTTLRLTVPTLMLSTPLSL